MILSFKWLHCSSPYKFLTQLCNSYPLWLYLMRIAPVVGTDGSTGWKWEFPIDVWNSCSALESLTLCGVLWTTRLLLEQSIPRGTTMVWSTAAHTSSYSSTLLTGMEGRIWGQVSLGRCPSSCIRGAEPDMSATQGWAYRQCWWYFSSGGSIHSSMGTAQQQCVDLRPGREGRQFESRYECNVCSDEDVLYSLGHQGLLVGVQYHLHG